MLQIAWNVLTQKEWTDILKSKNRTSSWGGRRKIPFAFTEQGIYMLMTVLKGDLAIKQSKTLIRTFKQMKDYIIENTNLLVNTNPYIESKFASYDKRFEMIEDKIDVVMDNFIDESTHKHFLILDGQKLEADIAYQNIYKQAQTSIIIIDDYIDVKTLQLLKSSKDGIDIKIVSDNKARNSLTASFISDSGLNISFIQNLGKFHDRYIISDYKTSKEKLYHCGSSSKDSGAKITAINYVDDATIYHPPIDGVLSNPALIIS